VDLDAVARVPGVESVTPELAPISSAAGATPECHGSVTSEADTLLHAADVREAFGVTGAGVKVGVISDSFNRLGGAAYDVATGDLPGTGNSCGRTTPAQVLADSDGADEGRAMAQVVHDRRRVPRSRSRWPSPGAGRRRASKPSPTPART
jgi:hypothetical protein